MCNSGINSGLPPNRAPKSCQTLIIILIMMLALGIPFLAGCVGIASPAKSNSTPNPDVLRISNTSLSPGSVEATYSGTLAATGGIPPYTWKNTGGELPAGLQLNAVTGIIAGTPVQSGSYSFAAEVRDAKASVASAVISLSISSAPTPTVTGVLPNSGPTGGGTTVTISGSNFRPGAGVQFGKIPATSIVVVNFTQIQAVVPAEPSGSVPVTVWNSGSQVATATDAFIFVAPLLQIATPSLPVGELGARYTTTLAATGGTPGYTWSITKGALPVGLQLNGLTGSISGTPALAGSSSFTVQVQDAKAISTSAGFALTVSPDPAPSISGMSQSSGPTSGGTAVTISGSNFRSGAVVQFGAIPAPSVQVVNSVQIQTVTPAEASGSVNVAVQNSDGQVATATTAFTFTAPTNTPWNPAVLGVPWASDFSSVAANEINVQKDPRLAVKAQGDGVSDDTSAIRAAIQLASSTGGGTVYFPSGDYRIVTPSDSIHGAPLTVPSRIILRGSSSATSRIFVNDPNAAGETDGVWTWGGIDFRGASLSGMTDLGIIAATSSSLPYAVLWNRANTPTTELFFNNLKVELNGGRQFWIQQTNEVLIQNCQFDSSARSQGPVYVVGNTNVSFLGNKVTYNFGRVHLQDNTNLLMQRNTLIRNALNEDWQSGTAMESGGVELSFSQNVQVLDNTIEALNAPTDESKDGEAITTQHSSVPDIQDAGRATWISSTTLTDTSALWDSATSQEFNAYPGTVIVILTGAATGEVRTIQSIATPTKTLTVTQPWNPVPEVGALYSMFRWSLQSATIAGNTLTNNPNGIVLWNGCYRCTISNNLINNSRGILLRTVDEVMTPSNKFYTYEPESRRVHDVAIDDSILGNTIANTLGINPAYIALDVEAYAPDAYHGMGQYNIQIGGNTLSPYPADPSHAYYPSTNVISQEGFFPCFLFGPAPIKDPQTTIFQRINFWNNSQSLFTAYSKYLLPYTNEACVTPSAPASNIP